MYPTSADDLARIASDLSQIAKQYTSGSQQLEQQVTKLDGTAAQLLSGGTEQWIGVASDAFQGAWSERRARMQQAATLLSQSAQYYTKLAQVINENLPQLRTDQTVLQRLPHLATDDQLSILNDESQAQNAIVSALATLNAQLDALAEEVKDCPEEQDGNFPNNGDTFNINKNDSGGDGSDNEEGDNKEDSGDTTDPNLVTPEGRLLTKHTQESLPRHNMTPEQVDNVIDNYSRKSTQSDGATVYIYKQPGRGQNYSIVIEGDDGIVTAMRDLSPKELANLGRRYGFNPNP